jgi:hypothetical protein
LLIDAIKATIDFRTSAFETAEASETIFIDPVTADCAVSVVTLADQPYPPVVTEAAYLHVLAPAVYVLVAEHADPTTVIPLAIMSKPVSATPFAIGLP